jgi:hypothetical protein
MIVCGAASGAIHVWNSILDAEIVVMQAGMGILSIVFLRMGIGLSLARGTTHAVYKSGI